METRTPSTPYGLLAGDAIAILAVTLLGFVTHDSSLATPRWLSTFLPVCAGWALIAPWMGLYDPGPRDDPRQLWRIPLAMLLAAPLAGWLRGFWLNSPVIPVFVLVLGLTSAAGVLLWRALWTLLLVRKR
ncbi:MAG: DUF3054 domain-containing protein [Chloroflexi bacterium]|nr:DUF3054 domain-containing protein [Chloroflexota bacterium]